MSHDIVRLWKSGRTIQISLRTIVTLVHLFFEPCSWGHFVRWHFVRWHFVRWHFVRWHFVLWHSVRGTLCPVAFCLWDVLSCGILSVGRFVLWHFVRGDILSCDILSGDILSCGILSGSHEIMSTVFDIRVYRAYRWRFRCNEIRCNEYVITQKGLKSSTRVQTPKSICQGGIHTFFFHKNTTVADFVVWF